MTTSRAFLVGVLLLAAAAALSGGWTDAARAQATVSQADLAEAGPLGEMALGADNAPVTIIEYASMTCPHCARFHEQTLPKLKERYIDTGKVRFIFREFPFDALGAGAFMLARCADKERYFPIVDLLFSTQSQWAVNNPLQPLFNVAKQAGYTQDTFTACLKNQQVLDGIQKVRDRAASRLGVNSTPTFFINGKRLVGALTIEEIEKEIEPYLKA